MPVGPRDHLREEAQLSNASDDQVRKSSTSEIIADQTSILQMVQNDLRRMRSQTPSPVSRRGGPRSISSSYPEQGIDSTGAPSPDSDSRNPKLDLGDLTKYSRTNDHLSGLRSSSSSSGGVRIMSRGSTHKTLVDAAAAFGHLQRQPTPSYHRFEVVSSSEDLPSNAFAPQNSMASQTSLEDNIEVSDTYPLTRVKANTQFDGPIEKHSTERLPPDSPSPSIKPPQLKREMKRKASGISLRSLTAGVKRSRVEFEKLAQNVCHKSRYKLRQACQNIKRQHRKQKKQYAAWKALRRKLEPGDAIKGKHEKGFASFSIEKSRHGTESWWKAGVDKFHAPKWMHFGQ
ncbi:hypothetical protein F53441_4424 [Fusarium austroafricanum]|uniref:Uncharacterized protein n=1 Tax=Fusarium austroafricanum TaxID=2364996 RepID=A0A8H4NYU5_9HYPO|nr:hypothetical protein F53441_4424 [Fusarium austroafricanum]